jgi:MFS family permease
MSNSAVIKPVGYMELIRGNRNFRLAWFSMIVSLTGDWFDLIASTSLLAQLGQPAAAIGILFVVRMLAPFIVTPFAGVLVDRFNRKNLLIITDFLRGAIVLCFLVVRRPEDAWLIYLITGLQLTLSGIYYPARSAILPDIVTPSELGPANAISSATWSVMLALGAALGGFSTGLFGVYPSFIFDSATFIISGLLEMLLVYRYVISPENQGKVTISSVYKQYAEGIVYLREHADIFFITLHKGALGLLVIGAFQVIQVSISQKNFVIGNQGGTGLGIMYGMVGLGTGIGPFVARYFAKDRDKPQRVAIVVGYALVALGMLVILPMISFEVVLLGMLLRGLGTGIVWVLSSQMLLQLLPNRVRGRVFSTEFAISTLMAAASSGVGGWAIDALPGGIPAIVGWLGALLVIPAVLWALWIAFGKLTPPEYVYQETPTELIPRDIIKNQSAGE